MEAEVSSSRYSGICLVSLNSLTYSLPRRAEIFQSMNLTASPATYGRDWTYSRPAPWNTESRWPKSRLFARRRTATSNCRLSTGS